MRQIVVPAGPVALIWGADADQRRQGRAAPRLEFNTITVRLRKLNSEVAAKAKPNVNAWINQLIEQAFGPRTADWSNRESTRMYAKF